MHEKTPLTTMVVCQQTISYYVIQEKYFVEAQFRHTMKIDEIFFGLLDRNIFLQLYNFFHFDLLKIPWLRCLSNPLC